MYDYYLPFRKELIERVEAINEGKATKRAYDSLLGRLFYDPGEFYFELDNFTEISASFGGRIIMAKEDRSLFGGESHDILHSTNAVSIIQEDGVIAQYVHIYPSINAGMKIKTGDIIGQVGGYNKEIGPHLHLNFYLDRGKSIAKVKKLLIPNI